MIFQSQCDPKIALRFFIFSTQWFLSLKLFSCFKFKDKKLYFLNSNHHFKFKRLDQKDLNLKNNTERSVDKFIFSFYQIINKTYPQLPFYQW